MQVVIKDFTIFDDGRATFDGRLQDADMMEHLQPDVIFRCIPCCTVGQGKILVAEYPQDSSLIIGMLLWLATRSREGVTEISDFAPHVQGYEAQKVAENLLRTLEDKIRLVESGEPYHLLEFSQEVKKMGNKQFANQAYRHAIDLYFSALLATGDIQISPEYRPKYIELRFDCFSNALQAFISTESWMEADENLQVYLASARHLNIWSGLIQYAVTASSLDPHSKVRELLDQLQAGRVRTEVEQRLQKLVDVFCKIEEIDKHILRIVQQRCPNSIAVFRAGLVRMHDAMGGMQRHILLESGSAPQPISLIQEHPLLVPYEASILQDQSSQTFSALQRKRETAREGFEEWSVEDRQEMEKAEELLKRMMFLNYVTQITESGIMVLQHSATILELANALRAALKSLQHHFIEYMPIPEVIRTELETKPITSTSINDDTFGLHLIQCSIFDLEALIGRF